MRENEIVNMWLKTCCSSEGSKDVYKSEVVRFFDKIGTDVETVNKQWKQVKYDLRLRDEFIEDWTEQIEQYVYANENLAPKTISRILNTLTSFFKRGLKIPVEPRQQKRVYVRFHNRDITKEEIRRILEHAELREKVFFLMMAESGLRPNTLCQLKYRNIKEDFEANRIPMKIELDAEIMKGRAEGYFTFVGEDSVNALKEYLQGRKLNGNDYLFLHQRNSKGILEHVTPEAFTQKFEKIAMKLGMVSEEEEKRRTRVVKGKVIKDTIHKVRLYNLRKYFNNNCKADRVYIEFWIGHSYNTQSAYVSRHVEEHRRRYAEAYESLRIYVPDKKLTDLDLRLKEKEMQLSMLTQQIEKLQPLLKLTEMLGITDEKTLLQFLEDLKQSKGGKVEVTLVEKT